MYDQHKGMHTGLNYITENAVGLKETDRYSRGHQEAGDGRVGIMQRGEICLFEAHQGCLVKRRSPSIVRAQ
jgi:hypothetical protein